MRFPHIAESIFKNWDNESVGKCRHVKREWKKILEAPRFLLIRQMHKTLENNCKLESIPKLLNISTHTLRELKTALTEFCAHPANVYSDTILKSTTAFHVVAGTGRTKLL